MSLIEKILKIKKEIYSFGKNNHFQVMFDQQINCYNMQLLGFGLGIPHHLSPENQIRGIFTEISRRNGVFLFNVNGVNLSKAYVGFTSYDEADGNDMITEWELSVILNNQDYLKKTIFHNGKVEFTKTKTGIRFVWK